MISRHRPWMIALGVFALLLIGGLTYSATILRNEGLDGLFKRKRDALQKVLPEAIPIQDKVEKQVREQLR